MLLTFLFVFDVNNSVRSQPTILGEEILGAPKCSILGEYRYFVLDIASQSTK